MENSPKIKARFHIYTGYRAESTLKHEFQAGEAYEVENDRKPHYIVKMWAFPQDVFYLCRSKDDGEKFTLFAKRGGTEDEPSFRRPVGFGYISHELKMYLEIQFTFPRQRVFMSLFPAPTTYDSLFGADGGVS